MIRIAVFTALVGLAAVSPGACVYVPVSGPAYAPYDGYRGPGYGSDDSFWGSDEDSRPADRDRHDR